jgi:serine/threonine-protein kinase RsbW
MSTYRHQLCYDGHLSDLPHIIDFVEESAEQAGVDPSVRFDLQLAVEEACANVIKHAYGGSGGDFEVCFEARGSDVVITLHDHGQAFDPTRIVRPDLRRPLEDRQVGGLGMYLMEKLMDEVNYTFAEDGNTLVMTKRDVIRAGKTPDK